MSKKKNRTNPFYVLLVVAGVCFCLTACAFGMLMLRDMRSSQDYLYDDEATSSAASFTDLVDKYAVKMMVGELIVLAIGTAGAIGTDSYFSGDESNENEVKPPSSEKNN
ncbi:MAG: hypothetical protein KDB27_13950 [Planctomycetales bacterium]|nr:hypothetical protein [Planctomycetales bacterium]